MMEVHREAVFAKAAGHYSRAILEAWAPGATTDRVVQVGHEIADPAFIVLVAEAAGDLIGFAMAIPTNGERWLRICSGRARHWQSLRRGTAIPCIRMSKRRPGPRVIALSAAT